MYERMQENLRKEHLFNHFGYVNTNCYEEVMLGRGCIHEAKELKVGPICDNVICLLKFTKGDPNQRICCLQFFAWVEEEKMEQDEEEEEEEEEEEARGEKKERKKKWISLFSCCYIKNLLTPEGISLAILSKVPGPALVCKNQIFRICQSAEWPYYKIEESLKIQPFARCPQREVNVFDQDETEEEIYLLKGYSNTLLCYGNYGTLAFMDYHEKEDAMVTSQILKYDETTYNWMHLRKKQMMRQHEAQINVDFLPELMFHEEKQLIYLLSLNSHFRCLEVKIFHKEQLEQSKPLEHFKSKLKFSAPFLEIKNSLAFKLNSRQFDPEITNMRFEPSFESQPWYIFCSTTAFEDIIPCYIIGARINEVFVFSLNVNSNFLLNIRHLHGPFPVGGHFLLSHLVFLQIELKRGVFYALTNLNESKTRLLQHNVVTSRTETHAMIIYDYKLDKASFTCVSPEFPSAIETSQQGAKSFTLHDSGHLILHRKFAHKDSEFISWTFEPYLSNSRDRTEIQLMPTGNFKFFSCYSSQDPFTISLPDGRTAVVYVAHRCGVLRMQIISADYDDQRQHREQYGVLVSLQKKEVKSCKRKAKKESVESLRLEELTLKPNKIQKN